MPRSLKYSLSLWIKATPTLSLKTKSNWCFLSTEMTKSLESPSRLHCQGGLMEGGKVHFPEHREETGDKRMTERGSTPKKDRAAYS